MKPENSPVFYQVKNGLLTFSIGINRIAKLARCKNGGPIPNGTRLLDAKIWAHDVGRALIGDYFEEDILAESISNAFFNGSKGWDCNPDDVD